MLSENLSSFYPNIFILDGLPGFESAHIWLSIPVFIMYVISLLGNSFLLTLIMMEKRLHSPMYYFLSALFLTDMLVSNSIALKMLAIFWLNVKEITFFSCLVQMFFIHSFSSLESGILLVMAYDRYVAICTPLHYMTTLTHTFMVKIAIAFIIRETIIVTPCPVMASRLPYCQTNHISHSYCDHMAVVTLACADITINSAYGLTVVLLVIMFDVSCITASYVLILKTVMKLPSRTAINKAFSTCTSHICVFLIAYTLGLFSFMTYRVGHIAPYVHVIVSIFYLLIPPAINPIIYGVKTKEIRKAAYNLITISIK
ncbi:olfactory receptor 52N2-like [Hyperolius riggenbachi]|uniref:olfactory receptor 52N2-like n=1 Tax=Hyperolius riggenbachi TaxID=752182 RepID=UPI0035A36A60